MSNTLSWHKVYFIPERKRKAHPSFKTVTATLERYMEKPALSSLHLKIMDLIYLKAKLSHLKTIEPNSITNPIFKAKNFTGQDGSVGPELSQSGRLHQVVLWTTSRHTGRQRETCIHHTRALPLLIPFTILKYSKNQDIFLRLLTSTSILSFLWNSWMERLSGGMLKKKKKRFGF